MKVFKQHPNMPNGFSKSFDKRFWRNVDKRSKDECWNWTGTLLRGYGRTYKGLPGSTIRAHRASFILHSGKDIPYGLCVLHSCDNPKCVNPNHLRLGTMADNCKDRDSRGRHFMQTKPETHVKGELAGGAKICSEDVFFIRKNKDLTNVSLGRWFSISPSQVQRIKSGTSWAHLL